MKKTMENTIFPLLLIFAAVFWGGGWVAAKFVSGTVSPQTLSFYRFIIAAVAFFPFVLLFRQQIIIPARVFLWALLGSTLFTGFGLVFFSAIRNGLPGAGGVLMTSMGPIFTYLLSIVLFHPRLTWRSALGLILGFSGAFFLLRLWTLDIAEIFKMGNGLFIICAFLYACVTIVNAQALKISHFAPYYFWFFLFSGLFSLPFSLSSGDIGLVFQQKALFWFNLLYLSLFGMAYAQGVYFFAAGRLGSHRASNFNFLVPGFAVLFSFVFIGEIPLWYSLAGGGLSLSAVYILSHEK